MKSPTYYCRAAAICLLVASPSAHSTPADALSAGKLVAFSHAADALESQCQSEADTAIVLADWRQRNQEQFQIIHAYGRKVQWYPTMAPDPSRWESLQKQERQRIAAQMADLLAPDKSENCRRLIAEYKSGKFDLRNFPEDLRAIEAYGR
jgi:hypothetical protein